MEKRGIYLVANRRSELLCRNLIASIRETGCQLPIRVLPFGGRPLQSPDRLGDVEILREADFPPESWEFLQKLRRGAHRCPAGFLRRFLGFYSEWDSFLYSDNDVVAMCDWTTLFDHLEDQDLVHADREYSTEGRYTHRKPAVIQDAFGRDAMNRLITAGHFLCRNTPRMREGLLLAARWMEEHPEATLGHDQSLLHLAILLGGWRTRNLCQPPQEWLSSWAGDYLHPGILIQATQYPKNGKISHLHFSGGEPDCSGPLGFLLLAYLDEPLRSRLLFRKRLLAGLSIPRLVRMKKGVIRRIQRLIRS